MKVCNVDLRLDSIGAFRAGCGSGEIVRLKPNTNTSTSMSMSRRRSMPFVCARPPLGRLRRHLPGRRHTVLYECFDLAQYAPFCATLRGDGGGWGRSACHCDTRGSEVGDGLLARRLPRGAGCIKAPHLIGGLVHYAWPTLFQRNVCLDCAGHWPDEKRSGMAKSRAWFNWG